MKITIDKNSSGRIFEGIGGVFSNGMTKLLEDYPAEQREDILRFLFEENFGASLQHVKVEIGSDVNTSSGTVPSHMRSKMDFDINRGSELWIAALAKKINPKITTEALRWGTPSWIKNDEDKYLYYLNFIKGADEEFGLHFDYLGCDQNEGSFDRDWVVKTLKPGLMNDGYGQMKLVAAESDSGWQIADDLLYDKELDDIVDVLNCHYTDESTETAINTGRPLWAGEHLASVRHDFVKGTLGAAYHMLSMYPLGKMTMYEMHPALEANYPSTPFNYKGILVASWPWSGHYEVTSGLWATAHFTQFIKPGWKYLDSASYAGNEKKGEEKCGYIALTAPDGHDWSLIFVNCCNEEKQYEVEVTGELRSEEIHVWMTDSQECFIKKEDIHPSSNQFTITIQPYSICSLTTTKGQKKGTSQYEIPAEKRMMLPWKDDFSIYQIGAQPVLTSDQGGAFEIDMVRGKKVLKQKITEHMKPIDWVYRTTPLPYTLLGSELWTDYQVEVEVLLNGKESFGYVGGRCVYNGKFTDFPSGYLFILHGDGTWKIQRENDILQTGSYPNLDLESYHKIVIVFKNECISAYLDGVLLVEIQDSFLSAGQAVIGCSYHETCFENLCISSDSELSCKRYSIKDSRISWNGSWTNKDGDYANYGRTLRSTNVSGHEFAFNFDGTSICIIGNRDRFGGMADIFLDDNFVKTIDTYSETIDDRKTKLSVPKTRNAIVALYGLEPGKHQIKLQVLGRKNKISEGENIEVDAIEVCGGIGLI